MSVTKQIPIIFSTAIRAVSYNRSLSALTILFTSGETYQYDGVPNRVALGFTNTESVGKYFHAEIKGQYTATKLEGQAAVEKHKTKAAVLPNLVHTDTVQGAHRRVLNAILNKGQLGMTAGEIKKVTGNENDDKRLNEMVKRGILKRAGKDTCAVTGKEVTLWAVNDEFMNF